EEGRGGCREGEEGKVFPAAAAGAIPGRASRCRGASAGRQQPRGGGRPHARGTGGARHHGQTAKELAFTVGALRDASTRAGHLDRASVRTHGESVRTIA